MNSLATGSSEIAIYKPPSSHVYKIVKRNDIYELLIEYRGGSSLTLLKSNSYYYVDQFAKKLFLRDTIWFFKPWTRIYSQFNSRGTMIRIGARWAVFDKDSALSALICYYDKRGCRSAYMDAILEAVKPPRRPFAQPKNHYIVDLTNEKVMLVGKMYVKNPEDIEDGTLIVGNNRQIDLKRYYSVMNSSRLSMGLESL